jgi:hypothetical protein
MKRLALEHHSTARIKDQIQMHYQDYFSTIYVSLVAYLVASLSTLASVSHDQRRNSHNIKLSGQFRKAEHAWCQEMSLKFNLKF